MKLALIFLFLQVFGAERPPRVTYRNCALLENLVREGYLFESSIPKDQCRVSENVEDRRGEHADACIAASNQTTNHCIGGVKAFDWRMQALRSSILPNAKPEVIAPAVASTTKNLRSAFGTCNQAYKVMEKVCAEAVQIYTSAPTLDYLGKSKLALQFGKESFQEAQIWNEKYENTLKQLALAIPVPVPIPAKRPRPKFKIYYDEPPEAFTPTRSHGDLTEPEANR